jgi:succinate dehydrogenase / fumarate reductase cytochrome b subunit
VAVVAATSGEDCIGMAETKHAIERPLSPHLGIYRMQITMLMSIVHRITGSANYVGTVLLAAWLVSIAMGESAYATVNALFGHPLGKLILFGYTWNLVHHMLGGIRHLVWDTGRAMQPRPADLLAWLTLLGSLSLTVVLWAVGLSLRGGL